MKRLIKLYRNNRSLLLVLTGVLALASMSLVGEAMAELHTNGTQTASAYVAQWGMDNVATINLDGLFATNETYYNKTDSKPNIIGPNSTGQAIVDIDYSKLTETPEVPYRIVLTLEDKSTESTGYTKVENLPLKWGTAVDESGNITNPMTFEALQTCLSNPNHIYMPADAVGDTKFNIYWAWDAEWYKANVSATFDQNTFLEATHDPISVKVTASIEQCYSQTSVNEP